MGELMTTATLAGKDTTMAETTSLLQRRLQAVELHRQGKSLREIGDIQGITFSTVHKDLTAMGVGKARPALPSREALAATVADLQEQLYYWREHALAYRGRIQAP